MEVITKKYQFLNMSSKTFSFLSRRRELGELQIWANKCVEDERPSNRVVAFLQRGVINVVKPKYLRAKEMEDKDDNDLIHRLPEDLLRHIDSE